MNIYETICAEVGSYDGLAVVDGKRRYSYQELLAESAVIAGRLRGLGIEPGYRVGVELENSAGYIAVSLAVLGCGAVIVPISMHLPEAEKQEISEKIELNALITGGGTADWQCQLFPEHPVRTLDLKDGRSAAFIRFSSGTTGGSKGVVLSHQAVLERTAACRRLRIEEGEAVLWVLDMAYHFVVTIILFLRRRAVIIMTGMPLEESMLRGLREYPIRLLYATPYHYRLLTSSPDFTPELLAPVRQAVSTAMRLEREDAAAFTAKFNVPLLQAYGIIEVGLPCLNDDFSGERVDSVGKLQDAYELKLNGESDGIGEICLRGPGLFDAYFSPFVRRSELFPDGFFHTGDLGRVDAEGYLFIVGRSKNMINFMGMKIFPYEVETVLNSFPEIRESLVNGLPTPGVGEIPAATLVLAENISWSRELEQSIRRRCFARLSAEKVPKHFTVVERLERTASGKPVRKK